MTHPLSEAGTSVEVKDAVKLAVEMLTALACHYEAQSIDTLSVADKIRLDNAASRVRNVAAALIQPTPAETEGEATIREAMNTLNLVIIAGMTITEGHDGPHTHYTTLAEAAMKSWAALGSLRSPTPPPIGDGEPPSHSGTVEDEGCIACDVPFKAGDMVLNDASGGLIHTACCGPERESYVNWEGDPLGPDDPIPTGWPWNPAPGHTDLMVSPEAIDKYLDANPPDFQAGELVPVAWQCREMGEGGWHDCSKAEYDRLQSGPQHDTRPLYATSLQARVEELERERDEAWAEFGNVPRDRPLAAHIKAALDELAETASQERARAEALSTRLQEAEKALEVERNPCGSCGVKNDEDCPRGSQAACWRDFHGGTRAPNGPVAKAPDGEA